MFSGVQKENIDMKWVKNGKLKLPKANQTSLIQNKAESKSQQNTVK